MMIIKTLATGSTGNCYYISDGITSILIEAGIPFKKIQRKLDFETSSLAGCLISHEHLDHCKAIEDVAKAGIDIYLSLGTKEALGATGHRLKTIEAKQPFTLGTLTIMPFEVEHDVSEPLGFLIASKNGDKLLFASDTYFVRYRFKGLTHIMVECNYSEDILDRNISTGRTHKAQKKRLLRSHFSLDNVKEFLLANDLSKVQEIWLLHLSDSNSDEERFKREVQEVTGKVVYVP
ncbi:MBL fold metallo-hydrolase [Paenalkalicoccus suaedae]|uniref:MBL fold metallo-hydrolase n=1 Tax=Paenalkalicoccus suaedae TaxID=2592382 RepID=A0A859FKE4_9BACI|nr:MBL fold metallo-hydrolase [Paenalkalicoccus suaedae]QKS73268.1 MBL fold metallo-hydrolase [Paenalkalicoccus suaedae]QKS73271.1 MBL fold metallo-hydrolase [Paenalkalicoccus suaedae]